MNCNETFNAGVCYITDAYKSVCRFNEELHADLEKYRTENEKLRELVKALNWCIDNGSNELGCDGCPLPQSSKRECECEIRMRELGIEVDE